MSPSEKKNNTSHVQCSPHIVKAIHSSLNYLIINIPAFFVGLFQII
jgi:hypothetical protein